TNSAVVMLSSMLEVTDTNANSGNVFVGGTISQGDFSRVNVSGFMSIGRFNENAAYYLTNGSLNIINTLEVGGGLGRPAKFVQYGGSNTSGALNVINEGEYDFYGGDVIANG